MFKDNQVVKLKRDLPSEHLELGTVEVIVMVYPADLSPGLPQSYEVEFAGKDGITLALVTLTDSDIEPAQQ